MISIIKGQEPQILIENAESWTDTLVSKIDAGAVPTNTEKTRYRHPQIKAALVEETNGKCAYCESKLLHIHHGDVEHIMPKSLEPSMILRWENLTLACEICNQNKSNLDPNAAHILDPYHDSPGDHLNFTGTLVLSKGTNKGTCSRTILDLNRGDLMERRLERLQGLASIAESVFRADLPLPARKALYADLVTNEAAPSAPYTAMARAFVRDLSSLLPAEVTN